MASPRRTRPLHNFTLPRLKWANQRVLRCMKLGIAAGTLCGSFDSDESGSRREKDGVINRGFSSESPPLKPIGGGDRDGIGAVREKIMLDLKVEADSMNFSFLPVKEAQDLNPAARPWNLRTRRAACKAPAAESSSGGGHGPANFGSSPQRPEAKSIRVRSLAVATEAMITNQSGARGDDSRPKFSVPLSRSEIEADFRAMAGIRPPRRPKKRPRTVQKEVDTMFPGLWLTEITPETYKVDDVAE